MFQSVMILELIHLLTFMPAGLDEPRQHSSDKDTPVDGCFKML